MWWLTIYTCKLWSSWLVVIHEKRKPNDTTIRLRSEARAWHWNVTGNRSVPWAEQTIPRTLITSREFPPQRHHHVNCPKISKKNNNNNNIICQEPHRQTVNSCRAPEQSLQRSIHFRNAATIPLQVNTTCQMVTQIAYLNSMQCIQRVTAFLLQEESTRN